MSDHLSWFTRACKSESPAAGRPTTFIAVVIILLWAGPLFDFSNTGTTSIIF